MIRRRPLTALASAAALSLVALVVATYGGGGTTVATASASTHASTATVATLHAARTRLGTILVDSHGHTLYLFRADKPKKSACHGACAVAWPPLRSRTKPTAGTGTRASLIGTIRRSDGAPQVTYNGHPLYRFVNDVKAGDVSGQGVLAFGARFFVVSPAGRQISTPAGIPQNNGGDHDSDNNGGPSDGDGNV
jgi:predicted lipoprotein with Yx(FWY)xxD motif